MTKSLEERFWSKVDKDGPTMDHMDSNCWTWTAYKDPKGYGHMRMDTVHKHKKERAHRVSLFLRDGVLPPYVLHKCDNPSCVRDTHLKVGTHEENRQDAITKGRMQDPNKQHGELNKSSKLQESDVVSIRSRAYRGDLHKQIAADFGVSRENVSSIVQRKTWAHIE